MPELATETSVIGGNSSVRDAKRYQPSNRRRLSSPGLRTFLMIADLWRLDETQRLLVLGLPSRSTYYRWLKAVREHRDITLDVDVLIRISATLWIHQALGVLHEDEADGVAWLRTPHTAAPFSGRPPVDLVASGTQDGLLSVRRFLDGARDGLYMSPNEVDHDFHPYTDADIVVT
ncbi:MbcA/ParS/Xre antitoxin family protein [Faunimonas pinastri]|uniref:MbcA/ParS/Xre antitoxin family protein n=1 Tax=Faunimonas pinastri TaxID=1855383 RepID=UPI000B89B5EF|nr:MbcA/ParS/Xre antitoxin family protein [Faunimonas pinastri]